MTSSSFFSCSGSDVPIDSELLLDLGGKLDQFGFLGIFGDGEELDDEVGHFVFLGEGEGFFVGCLDCSFEEQDESKRDFVVLEAFDVVGIAVASVVLEQFDSLVVLV